MFAINYHWSEAQVFALPVIRAVAYFEELKLANDIPVERYRPGSARNDLLKQALQEMLHHEQQHANIDTGS